MGNCCPKAPPSAADLSDVTLITSAELPPPEGTIELTAVAVGDHYLTQAGKSAKPPLNARPQPPGAAEALAARNVRLLKAQLSVEEAELAAAIEEAATAKPLLPPGQFAETWDGGDTFHWSGDKDKVNNKIPAGSARAKAERRALKAVQAVDAAALKAHDRPKNMSSYRGVRVSRLKALAATLDRSLTTAEVVERHIKPQTAARRCRYVELLEPSDVGEANLFTSHTWGAPFVDLVAAIAHIASDNMCIWLDIFAVSRASVQSAHAHVLRSFSLTRSSPFACRCASGRVMAATSTSGLSCATPLPSSSSHGTSRRWRR